MNTMQVLLDASKEIWEGYYTHPFVRGIQDGTLDKEKFKYYIMQDFLYLIDYAKVFSLGIAKAKSMETLKLFSSYVQQLTDGEMDIHKGYLGMFKITQEEMDQMPVALDNISYTSYMLRVAYAEGEAEILAAILSCAYSYELIAKKMTAENPKAAAHPFYGSWVQGYASDDYSRGNEALIEMLNRLTADYTERQMEHLKEIFVACSRYEMMFWDMAWEMKK
ncbi:MAG: thiaminase II [Lachnospiraceae bacterium]